MQDRVLPALLVVQDDLQGDAGTAGPFRIDRVAAVADHVTGIGCGHAVASCRFRLILGGDYNRMPGRVAMAQGVNSRRTLFKIVLNEIPTCSRHG